MLRHSVFAVVLVAAAFAGGAVMNGTGLSWFKALASGGPRIVVDNPAAPPGASAPAPTTAQAAQAPASNPRVPAGPSFPTASMPALDLGLPPGQAPVLASAATPDDGPALPTAPSAVADPAAAPALTEPPDLSVPPAPAPALASPAKSDPVTRLASAQVEEGPASASASASPAAASDWAALRERLKAAGVSRYEITAEVGGRARFVCVIPVDGLRAVGHRFEADGDDEFQAADAALRRVDLWRATESR